MNFTLFKKNISEGNWDILCAGISEEESKKLSFCSELDKRLSEFVRKTASELNFKGEKNKTLLIPSNIEKGAKKIALIGTGKEKDFTSESLRLFSGAACKLAKSTFSESVSLYIAPLKKINEFDFGRAVADGFGLFNYSFDKYKTKKDKDKKEIKSVEIILPSLVLKKEKEVKNGIEFSETVIDSVLYARNLINEPPEVVTPSRLAEEAEKIAKKGKLKIKIFDEKTLMKEGFGALLAVSLGSVTPPRFIHLHYTPEKSKGKKHLAIIGKGITYDSGGLCIKPRDGMLTMKTDMSGAAAVLGVMKNIRKISPDVEISGIISSTENMPSGSAYKPDTIIKSLSGKTIEVINTDAEGRLVLADAIAYAKNIKVTEIVDLATLTGACMVALGEFYAGVMSNDDELCGKIINASKSAGEKLWRLPLDEELKDSLKSEIADVKNLGGKYGGAITAALFLQEFVEDMPWVHLDIAGPARREKDGDYIPQGGTGAGIRTLFEYLNKYL